MKRTLLILVAALLFIGVAEHACATTSASRVKTWTTEKLYAADLNAEFDNLVNYLNNNIAFVTNITATAAELNQLDNNRFTSASKFVAAVTDSADHTMLTGFTYTNYGKALFDSAQVDTFYSDANGTRGDNSFFFRPLTDLQTYFGTPSLRVRSFTGDTVRVQVGALDSLTGTTVSDTWNLIPKTDDTGTIGRPTKRYQAANMDTGRIDVLPADMVLLGNNSHRGTTNKFDKIVNMYGSVLIDADSLRAVLPDTTFAAVAGASAKRIIVGRLDDPAVMWNYSEFVQRAKNTSWWKELGPFPISYAITITGGQDSVIVWDRERATRWMVFVKSGTNILGNGTFNDIKFLDGILYVATSLDPYRVDFVKDAGYVNDNAAPGLYRYAGTVSQRNSGLGLIALSGPQVVNTTINAVSVIRDPDGGVETEMGNRPKHVMWVATADDIDQSSPGITDFYNSNLTTEDIPDVFAFPNGSFIYAFDNGSSSSDYVSFKPAVQTADGWGYQLFSLANDKSGSQDMPWTNSAVVSRVSGFLNQSISDNGSPVLIIGSNEGLVISHTKINNASNGANIFIDASRNSPLGKGSAVLMAALEDTIDSSPYANNLTRSGTGAGVTLVNGVIGKADSLDGTANGYLTRQNDTDFRMATTTPKFTIAFWTKSNTASNPGAIQACMELGTSTASIQVYFNTSGQVVARASDDRSNWDTITFAQDVYDALWHQLIYTSDGTNFKLYADGENVGSTALSNVNAALNVDTLFVGAYTSGTNRATIVIDQLSISSGIAWTANEVGYDYQRGLRGLQSTADPNDALPGTNNDVDYVQVDPKSGYIVVGREDTCTVFDQYAIPVAKFAAPAGNHNDVAIYTYAGQDSFALFQATTTQTKWTQPDAKISELARVTSPGQGGHDPVWRLPYYAIAPEDSGTVTQGALTITGADSIGKFKYADTSPGNLRVGLNAEFRGTIRWGASSAVGADIAEMFAVPGNNYRVAIRSIPSETKEFFAPALLRASTITITDDDSTRTYPFTLHKSIATERARIILDASVKGRIGKNDTSTVFVRGVEPQDWLYWRIDSLTVGSTRVVGVRGDTVKVQVPVPAGKEFWILPPNLLLKFTGSVIQAGDVVQMGPGKTMRLSQVVGRRGWIVSSGPATLLNADAEGVPVALIGTVPCVVSADSGIVVVGDPLTAGAMGVAVRALRLRDDIIGWAQEAVLLGQKKISVLVE